MSDFKTYRVRYCEWQTFALNVGARSAGEACELARNIRSGIGQEPFEEIDGAIDNFEAEELTSPTTGDSPPEFPSALDLLKRQGSAS
ncbi:MAG: hypothetical protein WAN86_14995 [Hyphomicrobiaceae bacterium]